MKEHRKKRKIHKTKKRTKKNYTKKHASKKYTKKYVGGTINPNAKHTMTLFETLRKKGIVTDDYKWDVYGDEFIKKNPSKGPTNDIKIHELKLYFKKECEAFKKEVSLAQQEYYKFDKASFFIDSILTRKGYTNRSTMDVLIATSFINRYLTAVYTYIDDLENPPEINNSDAYVVWEKPIFNDLYEFLNSSEANVQSNLNSNIHEQTTWNQYVNLFFDKRGIITWNAYIDANSKIYYYNPITKESQYSCPIDIPEGWMEVNHENGLYYSNGKTSQLHCPLEHVKIEYKQEAVVS